MLTRGIVGARHTGQSITWTLADGTPIDLTGAALSGSIRSVETGDVRAIAGTLTADADDLASGVFTWNYADADLVAGVWEVQFVATFGALSDKTSWESWTVED